MFAYDEYFDHATALRCVNGGSINSVKNPLPSPSSLARHPAWSSAKSAKKRHWGFRFYRREHIARFLRNRVSLYFCLLLLFLSLSSSPRIHRNIFAPTSCTRCRDAGENFHWRCISVRSFSLGYTLIFYTCFFAGLAVLFSICMKGMLATLSYQKPKWTLKDSLIGTNPGKHTLAHLSTRGDSFRTVHSGIACILFERTFQAMSRATHVAFYKRFYTQFKSSTNLAKLKLPRYFVFIKKNHFFFPLSSLLDMGFRSGIFRPTQGI